MQKKWDNRNYLLLQTVNLSGNKLNIEFDNKDTVQIMCSALAPPGLNRIHWAKTTISSDRLHLVVPAEPSNFEIAWYVIRSLTDTEFATHMVERATRQSEYIGTRLRQLRERRGLTQAQVAGRAKIQPANLSRIENGHFDVSTSTLWKVLAAMGYSPADLSSNEAEKTGSTGEWATL